MTTSRDKLEVNNKRKWLSPIFKDILCLQTSQKSFSPILQNILNIPGGISLFQGNQTAKYIKFAY